MPKSMVAAESNGARRRTQPLTSFPKPQPDTHCLVKRRCTNLIAGAAKVKSRAAFEFCDHFVQINAEAVQHRQIKTFFFDERFGRVHV